MKKLLLLACLILPLMVSAQKLQKPTIDQATGDTVWRTSKELIAYTASKGGGTQSVKIWFSKSKNKYVLSVLFQTMNGDDVFLVNEGQHFMFQFADNSQVLLPTDKTLISKYGVDEAANVYTHGSLTIIYSMTDSDIAKLEAGDMKYFRIEFSESNYDCVIDTKSTGKIKKSLDLIVNAK